MPSLRPHVVTASTLSGAWSGAFLAAHRSSAHELAPLTLRVEFGQRDSEDELLQSSLELVLAKNGDDSTKTVADTIFPERQWLASRGDRQAFFARYRKVYPRLKALDVRNRNGTYFGRLIEPTAACRDGQLERLISSYVRNNSLVKMRLQASLFDPARDFATYDRVRPGFPCLQHLSLAPYGGELSLNAFYASQQLLTKAYGNYAGLASLGRFLAGEMELAFAALNVFVGMAKLERGAPGREYNALVAAAEACVARVPGATR